MTQRTERYTHHTIHEVANLNDKIASTRSVVEIHAPNVLSLFKVLSKHLAKSLSLININNIELSDDSQAFTAQDLYDLQQVLFTRKCDLQLTVKNGKWNLNLPRYFLKPPALSFEILDREQNQDFFLQYQNQLSQLRTHLYLFRHHFLQTKGCSSICGSEIIRISADILVKLHQHFAASNEINSAEHHLLVFALYEFLHENLVSSLLQSDLKSAKSLEKYLESTWVGCCCEVIVFIALNQILNNNPEITTPWELEFADIDADRTDAIDILLTINSKRIHMQIKARNHTKMASIEVFDSTQLLQSPTDLTRLKIDYEGIERLQIGLFQLNAQGIVIVVNENLLNLETASPSVEFITRLEQALQTIGVLPQAYWDIV